MFLEGVISMSVKNKLVDIQQHCASLISRLPAICQKTSKPVISNYKRLEVYLPMAWTVELMEHCRSFLFEDEKLLLGLESGRRFVFQGNGRLTYQGLDAATPLRRKGEGWCHSVRQTCNPRHTAR